MPQEPPFDHSPITEREYDLPGDANVALWVAPNVEYFAFGAPGLPLYP